MMKVQVTIILLLVIVSVCYCGEDEKKDQKQEADDKSKDGQKKKGHGPQNCKKMCAMFANRTEEELEVMDKKMMEHEKCRMEVVPSMGPAKKECFNGTFGAELPDKPSDIMKIMCSNEDEKRQQMMHQFMMCLNGKMVEDEKKKNPDIKDEDEVKKNMYKKLGEKCGPMGGGKKKDGDEKKKEEKKE